MSKQNSIPVSFGVEELTDAENLVRFASFQPWLDGSQPFMVETRIERSLAANEILPKDLRIDRMITSQSAFALVATGNDLTITIEVEIWRTSIRISADTQQKVDDMLAQITQNVEQSVEALRVPVRVWSAMRGGDYDDRLLETPRWTTITNNYPVKVREQLEDLMTRTAVGQSEGRLLLWSGPPGTGKTTAIRALAREWSNWCAMQYISDPEQLFNNSAYLAEVLQQSARNPKGPTLHSPSKPDDMWRLLVLEDSDEFLRSNARQHAGAALGRVLNLSDGIFGQHHNVMILLTTNEEVNRLHPALVRPGRCLANVEFTKFSPAEAKLWLDGQAKAPTRPQTLAQLLARRGDIKTTGGVDDEPLPIGAYL